MECCKLQNEQFALIATLFTGSPKFAGVASWGRYEGWLAGRGRGHTNCQPCAVTGWGWEGGVREEDDSEVIGGRLRHSDF